MPNAEDGRLRGYEDYAATRPTAFRRYLEADPLVRAKPVGAYGGGATRKRPDAAERLCGPAPEGYEKPTTWKRLAESPEGTVLMATHEGWESIAHELVLEEVEKPDSSKGKALRGTTGRIWWRGWRLGGVALASLRVPGRGDRELRHG